MQADIATIARRFVRAWSAQGDRIIDELAAPDIIVSYSHLPEPLRGKDAYKEMIRETVRSFPDLETRARHVLVDGDRAAVHWTYTGTHRQGTLYGVEPSGTRVHVHGMARYHVQNGRVTTESGVGDTFSLMTQLHAGSARGR